MTVGIHRDRWAVEGGRPECRQHDSERPGHHRRAAGPCRSLGLASSAAGAGVAHLTLGTDSSHAAPPAREAVARCGPCPSGFARGAGLDGVDRQLRRRDESLHPDGRPPSSGPPRLAQAATATDFAITGIAPVDALAMVLLTNFVSLFLVTSSGWQRRGALIALAVGFLLPNGDLWFWLLHG